MKSENNHPSPASTGGIAHHTPGRDADYREHLDETRRDKIAEIIWKRTEISL